MTKRMSFTRTAMVALTLSMTLAPLQSGAVFAQSGTPSSKAAAKPGNITLIPATLLGGTGATTTPWSTVLATNIQTSQQKDLFLDVSLEVGLLTRTLVRSKTGSSDGASSAGVEIQVLVDGKPAQPGTVPFGGRTQTLTATFQGIIQGCLSQDPATGSIIIDPNCVTPEELKLILDTMNAASFNFALDDVGGGVHSVQVQARINLAKSLPGTHLGEVEASATFGKGSVTVEENEARQGSRYHPVSG